MATTQTTVLQGLAPTPFAIVIVIVKAVPMPLHAMMTVGKKAKRMKTELRLPPPLSSLHHYTTSVNLEGLNRLMHIISTTKMSKSIQRQFDLPHMVS